MRERSLGLDPLDAVLLERHRSQERRADAERVNRGADVVTEAREGQLGGPRAAADRGRRLEDEDGAAGPREHDRGRQAVRPRTDDDGVGHSASTLRPNQTHGPGSMGTSGYLQPETPGGPIHAGFTRS